MTPTPALYASFILLLILAIVPALPLRWRPPPYACIVIWMLPYVIYAAAGGFHWQGFVTALAICVPPAVLYSAFPVRRPHALCWQDALAWLWLALDVLLHPGPGIWLAPKNLDFMLRLFVVVVAAWSWVFIRPVPGLGYSFAISIRVIRAAAVNFLFFAALAIPASLALRFSQWNPQWHGAVRFCIDYVEIFVFIAWLEELLFRGFLQNLLSNTLKSPLRGQAVASLIFGLSHILHAPFPNWRYVLLASVAGWFYGRAFRQGGNMAASSLMHAAVDTVWRTFFLKHV